MINMPEKDINTIYYKHYLRNYTPLWNRTVLYVPSVYAVYNVHGEECTQFVSYYFSVPTTPGVHDLFRIRGKIRLPTAFVENILPV